MSFEIFDDVAFYWFLQVILGVFIIPITIYRVFNWCTKKKVHKIRSHPHVNDCDIPDYIPSQTLISERNETIKSKLSLFNIFFCALWVIFLLLMIQLPKWQDTSLTDFDPYQILGIEQDATELDMKRARRKLAFTYHVDRCKKFTSLTEQECNDKFILIDKAYKVLTDPETKENWRKYRNADGFQGVSATIGIHPCLANPDNASIILGVYFVGLIILVVTVGGWWKYSSKYHKSGVYKQSIDVYWRFIKQNMKIYNLVNVLAASAEYKMLSHKIPSDVTNSKFKQYKILKQQVTQHFTSKKLNVKGLFNASYVERACVFLNAHLIGLTIPNELKEEYLLVLQEAPKLLDVMIDMTLQRERYLTQSMMLIRIKQAIIQGVWPFESNLKQLPYWTKKIDSSLKQNKCDTITDLNFLDEKNLRAVLTEAYKEDKGTNANLISDSDQIEYTPGSGDDDGGSVKQQVKDAMTMVRMYPGVFIDLFQIFCIS